MESGSNALEDMYSWNVQLLHAAKKGDNNKVAECLANGADSNYRGNWGVTPLHLAANKGHNTTVSLLLSKGSVINIQSELLFTPLHMAANYGHSDTVSLLISKGAEINSKDFRDCTPYDHGDEQIRQLINSKGTVVLKTEHIERKDPSVMLNRLLGEGSYESYDMRIMVTGQFGVGKTSLVMILVGENVSNIPQSTNGISLLEGRCGLRIEGRKWILIDKGDYNALDVVYNKVLMSSEESQDNVEVTQAQTPTIIQPTNEDTSNVAKAITRQVRFSDITTIKDQPHQFKKTKVKTKITIDEISKKMAKVLKNGKYAMKIGRLVFWDFGGQFVYYTTHQTFMTYRALFLVVFDGSKSLTEEAHDVVCFPGQHGTPTAAVFLQHWVNSILTYCKVIYPGIPQILFVATHKDKVPKEDVEKKRSILYTGIEELFSLHEGRTHLHLEHRLFVNATDKNDPEISILKRIITDLTFEHPCWGERMPNAWVTLELEIAELAAKGNQVLSHKEVEDLNRSSKISVLSEKDLKFFLQFQHSLGKIVYFDTPQLREFVIINPLFMVEVMKSFVTDQQFWPKDDREQKTFKKMSMYGVMEKNDLFAIWKRKQFAKILPHKEFVFDMLVHLDILSEQRRYDITTGSRLKVEKYFVPCMLTRINTTSYMETECIPDRAIGLAFVFKGTIIPPALPNRLISACLSMWSVKDYHTEKLLFSGFVAFSWDTSHDIIVCVKSNKILVYMVHRRSKGLIVSDIATGVRECIHTTLQRISEFYRSSTSNEPFDREQPFHVEFACSDLKCYMPETPALRNRTQKCVEHGNKIEVDVWYQDKYVYKCDTNCDGLSTDALGKTPSDAEILRLSSKLDPETTRQLALHLGMEDNDWKNLEYNYPRDCEMVKFTMLIKWRDLKNGTFKHIADALTTMDIRSHLLCQVRRIRRNPSELPEEHLFSVPTDEILDSLAPEIGKVSFQLGIELGRSVPELEAIYYDYEYDLVTQTKKILYNWRNDMTVKATLCVLEQALMNVGRGAMCLKIIVDDLGVKKPIIKTENEKIHKSSVCVLT